MKSLAAGTESIWMKTLEMPTGSALGESISCDVCVIGAGIAGLTTAYLLAEQGRNVVVIDKATVGGGETARTTAHLTAALDDRYVEIERLFGDEGARLAAESHTAAIDKIEQIVGLTAAECEFERVDGYLFVPRGQNPDVLDRELAAAHRAGLRDLEIIERAPLPHFDTGPALRFPGQAQFHPLKFLVALSRAIQARGGRIFTQTTAEEVHGGKAAYVKTSSGQISTAAVVVATNVPVNDWVTIHAKQAAYRSYVIGIPIARDSVPRGLYWDTADPYHYARLQREGDRDVLIVGGEDHKTGQAHDANRRYEALEAWAGERFHATAKAEYRWSGQIIEPIDALAYIGRNPGDEPNVFIATGDSGNGMTHGTIAGMILCDLVMGLQNRWADLYDPSRITAKAAAELLKESANFVAQYTDWITPGEVDDPTRIAPGSGAIIRSGARKIAAYKDPDGRLSELSAVCPHMGCVVSWNPGESTWDCPCHGSRFDPHGKVINGPAISNLRPHRSTD